MKKVFFLLGIVVVLLFGGVYGWYQWRQGQLHARLAAAANPAVIVSATRVQSQSMAGERNVVGEIVPQQGAVLSPQTGGVVQRIGFHSGATVQKGQLLLSLDPGALPGQLQAAQAQAALARVDYQRAEKVFAIHGISTAALDKARYGASAAQAQVTALQESLADMQIRAPFAGVLGLRTVNQGEYIHAGMPVAHIENLRQLYADFTVPQRDVQAVQVGAPVRIDVHNGDTLRHYHAKVQAVASHVDAQNRAVSVRARIAAPQGLKPGMFVRVILQKEAPTERLMIPMVAVSFNTYGDFVYVLTLGGPDKTLIAKEQPVTTGMQRGNEVVIRSGLKTGDLVVTAGQVKLHSGDHVRINNAVHL